MQLVDDDADQIEFQNRPTNAAPLGYPCLNDEIMNQIREWMNTDGSTLIVNRFGRLVYASDIHHLRIAARGIALQDLWLEDQIIDLYIDLVVDSTNQSGGAMVHGFEAQFWVALRDHGYEGAKLVAGDIDIMAYDKVFIPINHDQDHWGLAVIYPQHREIKYYDSWKQTDADNEDVLSKLNDYVVFNCIMQEGSDCDTIPWLTENVTNVPRQRNKYDCGVFVCAFAKSIAHNQHDFLFTQKHMPYFRNTIAYEIGTVQMMSLTH